MRNETSFTANVCFVSGIIPRRTGSIYKDPYDGSELIAEEEGLRNTGSGKVYPIVKNIPRFVNTEGYASSFGVQWMRFQRTQLDSYNGSNISISRLYRCLNGHLDSVKGKLILEAGSGAGRFTEILLSSGAIVHSFDLSSAVEANYSNNGHNEALSLAQADIRHLPYRKESYDYVVCLGVLQHTPSPEDAIFYLYEMLKPGGILVFDHYIFKLRNVLPPPIGVSSNLYRWVILLLPQSKRFNVVVAIVKFFFPFHWVFRNSIFIQRVLRRISPLIFYFGTFNLKSKEEYFNWSLLDTHDCLTDFYKHHRSVNQIRRYHSTLGAEGISVKEGGNGLEAFCQRGRG